MSPTFNSAKLFLNSTEHDIHLVLFANGKLHTSSWESHRDEAPRIPAELKKICDEAKISPENITEIFIVPGPGPFTGIRVGIVIANIFSAFNQAKLYQISKTDLPENITPETFETWEKNITPVTSLDALYDKPVNITPSKKEPLIS